eukprot:514673_1
MINGVLIHRIKRLKKTAIRRRQTLRHMLRLGRCPRETLSATGRQMYVARKGSDGEMYTYALYNKPGKHMDVRDSETTPKLRNQEVTMKMYRDAQRKLDNENKIEEQRVCEYASDRRS